MHASAGPSPHAAVTLTAGTARAGSASRTHRVPHWVSAGPPWVSVGIVESHVVILLGLRALAETVTRLDATIVKQEARIEKIADEIRSELAGQTNEVLDRATFRIGMAVGIGVLSSLLIAGVLGLVALRTGLLGRKN